MSKVYFIAVNGQDHAAVSAAGRKLLETLVEQSGVTLEKQVPIKTHFGEKGNRTFIQPECYNGIIDCLKEHDCADRFLETTVLYGGKRFKRDSHLALAAEHGFTALPVEIADGASGEELYQVDVDLKHFDKCTIGKAFERYKQVLVLSHFKGHALAGFGGAIKQLSMGFASKGGKLAMHMNVRPRIIKFLCKRCGMCVSRCQANAITLGKKPHIDHQKCLGCGACFSVCRHHAVSILSWKGLVNAIFKGKFFREKLVEYAFAACQNKQHIFINFALNITRGCDCEPLPMKPCIHDIGVFASLDPVAIDRACYDAAMNKGKKFAGAEQLDYAEKIGLGSNKYELIELPLN
ncbi:MAG: DUF362 domain-containing protein [Lentisphaerae bacterium]|nr:DUF362 domain-containing protein [Lentisphaerota bacterium]